MALSPETSALIFLAIAAFGMVLWGYQRSKKTGRIGLLAWGQSLALTAPWLFFVACVLLRISLDLIGLVLLLVASAGAYIYLGNLRREAGQEEELRKKALERIQQEQAVTTANSPPELEITPIDSADLQLIKGIFGIDTFFSTESIPYQDGVIFKGNLRGEPDSTHARLTQKLEDMLGNKYRLFLVEDPEGRPVVIVLPSSNDPKTTTLAQKNIALVLLLATVATSLEAIGILKGFDLSSNVARYGGFYPSA